MKRINMKDIAKEANVSVATVSYVINKKVDQKIPKNTVDRVETAIKKLGYVPNLAARSLVHNKSNLIGVVIPQTEPGKQFMFSNPFYGELLSSIEYNCRISGYHVLISGTDINQSYLEIANKRSLDGIIIVGIHPSGYYKDLINSQIPVVLIDSYCAGLPFMSISLKDREGARMATEYLIKKGHTKIGFASGEIKEDGVTYDRYQGYLDSLKDAGIDINQNYIFEGNVSQQFGRDLGYEISKSEDRPTAIFASADVIAVGLINGLKRNGFSLPDDMSIIGFDDTWLARDCDPKLTTIKQDVALKGKMAVDMLLTDEDKLYKNDMILDVELVERESVKKKD
ncbi:MAG: LacI family DNA-binding transcriptional regulator [Sphaerochaeta sp.]